MEEKVQDEGQVIIGRDASLKTVFDMVRRVARTNSTVLVTGESGTGKELVVQTLHNMSGRKGPFVPVNCGAMPEDLIESELFGAEKGAYTGAYRAREGRFELANKGTLFLDEIGEMPPQLQVKLLRALQEREVQRIGGSKPIKVDVRVVAATNRDLEQEVKKGNFREDLYYRLNVIPVKMPPLRTRGDDILALARHYLALFCRENDRPMLELTPEAQGLLLAYPWPGNVRELENFMYRVSVLTEGDCVGPDDLPEKIRNSVPASMGAKSLAETETSVPATPAAPLSQFPERRTGFAWPTLDEMKELDLSLRDFLGQMEDRLIAEALEREHGVHHRAAALLGIKRTTLIEKLKRKAGRTS